MKRKFPTLRRMICAATLFLAASLTVVAAPSSETAVLPLSGMGEPGEAPVLWDFQVTAGRRAGEWTQIRVPSNWETEGFGTYYYGTDGRKLPDSDPLIPKEVGHYRTRFTVPADWQGRAVRIVFEGAMTDTTVAINGQQAGAMHQGSFYRFEYDLTASLKYGAENLLEVTVAKESANTSVNRAERRGDYWTFGGIYRPVWLEARPAQYIERTAIDARADGSFSAQVYLGAAIPAGASASVTAQIFDEKNQPVGAVFSAPVEVASQLTVIRGRIEKPLTWTAETPHLYRVKFNLLTPSTGPVDPKESRVRTTLLHSTTERFGFRTIEVRAADGVYLNGQKIKLKGVNRHCFWPETGRTITREQSYADARLIKEANMNAVRMSHYPPDKHFLEACDELGLYVLDELAGWQGCYDTPTGARLIGQIVRRDVNHPSILFWDNGNEGGWNTANDGEFAKWDPQQRAVLHPWEKMSGIDTNHYEKYDSTVNLCKGPLIFMPTEFLHGLYDGGIGAGLRDYWDVMGTSPLCAGGFFWVFADEGVVRTDQGGRIDNHGNSAPDGMVGPHHEKEGSFFAVKEIWSPVQVKLQADPGAPVVVENHYDFTNLNQCTFEWQWVKCPDVSAKNKNVEVLATKNVAGPDLAPGKIGTLVRPDDSDDNLRLIARNPDGQELWRWTSFTRFQRTEAVTTDVPPITVETLPNEIVVRCAPLHLVMRFDCSTGFLKSVETAGKNIELGNGPRLVARHRKDRIYEDLSGASVLKSLTTRTENGQTIIEATYEGKLTKARWGLWPFSDTITMDYEYVYDGEIDILGIRFDLPDSALKSKRWLGRGPYRVWQNRQEGGVFDLHEVAFNDPIPGQTFVYPEFKGFFRDWRWLSLETTSGRIGVQNADGSVPYFALGKIKSGEKDLITDWPDMGLAFLHVIPAIGTKFDAPDGLGPQSRPRTVSGVQHGSLIFRFEKP